MESTRKSKPKRFHLAASGAHTKQIAITAIPIGIGLSLILGFMLLAYHVPIWMIYSGIILMTCLGGFVYFNLVRKTFSRVRV